MTGLLVYVEILGVLIAVIASVVAVLLVVGDQKRLQRQIRKLKHQNTSNAEQIALLQETIRQREAEESRLHEEVHFWRSLQEATEKEWQAEQERQGVISADGETARQATLVESSAPRESAEKVTSGYCSNSDPRDVRLPSGSLAGESDTEKAPEEDRSITGRSRSETVPARSTVCREAAEASELLSGTDVRDMSLALDGRPRDWRLQSVYGCACCEFSAQGRADVKRHVAEAHVRDLTRPMTYPEVAKLDRSLPPGIYRCTYCNFYIPSTDPANPTSGIVQHIVSKCMDVPRSGAPVKVAFRTITDIEEVRAHVLAGLQHGHVCKICDERIISTDEKAGIEHLFSAHLDKLVVHR